MWDITTEWVVGLAGLGLGIIGLWLTIYYGKQHQVGLQRICKRLDLKGDDKRSSRHAT